MCMINFTIGGIGLPTFERLATLLRASFRLSAFAPILPFLANDSSFSFLIVVIQSTQVFPYLATNKKA